MNSQLAQETGIVIVFYQPNNEDIHHAELMASYYQVVIVDNSPHAVADMAALNNIVYIHRGENMGIATAQNIGISYIIEHLHQLNYLVFFDQDSRPAMDYPQGIVEEYMRISKHIPRLSALGPRIRNKQTQEEYTPGVHHEKREDFGFVEKQFIISSGCCIHKQTFVEVGMNDDTLFIDFVDFEWCLRAHSKGYTCGITDSMEMDHFVGRKYLALGPFRDIISAPQRYFYQYRNYIWLARRNYIPTKWNMLTGVKYMLRFAYLPFFFPQGFRCIAYSVKGICAAFSAKHSANRQQA